MRLFFYTTVKTPESTRYKERLRKLEGLEDLSILPPGCGFKTPLGLELRSGDLIIFYAANSKELEELANLIKQYATSFRIIIALGINTPSLIRRAYLLGASFVTSNGNGPEKIAMVVNTVTHGR